jgi:CRISPR-associated protein Cas1
MPKDLHELPKIRDSLSYLYIEHAKVEQDDKSIAFYDQSGKTPVPIATVSVLMLGLGTAITHEAVKTIVENGCLILWCGEEGVRFYAQGMGETRKAGRLLLQAALVSDPCKHLTVVRKMYMKRFPKESFDNKDYSLEELRGMEGVRVRTAYFKASKEYDVIWKGRSYKRDSWFNADPINRALSCANSNLYGICHSAIVSAGCSPGLGFIHTGKQLSFVYDIADLYKTEFAIPIAFNSVSESTNDIERRIRITMRDLFRENKLLSRIISDIDELLGHDLMEEPKDNNDFDSDAALPAQLWGGNNIDLKDILEEIEHDDLNS